MTSVLKTLLAAAVAALTVAPTMAAAQFHHPGTANCSLRWYTQYKDQYGGNISETYQEKVYVYDKFYKPGGPLFFYTGNEGPVENYVNWTGTMWTQGEPFGALLVWAEHRFFGQSMPCPGGFRECGQHLISPFQAMRDYATLIRSMQEEYSTIGTIVFGGSYGGMLSAWMRMHYPSLVDGAVASSAPLGCFEPTYMPPAYWKVVSHDATASAGSSPTCFNAVHAAITEALFPLLDGKLGSEGPRTVQEALRLCTLPTKANKEVVATIIQAAFDNMAMGNYNFPTSYIFGSYEHPAPAFPVRVACKSMTGNVTANAPPMQQARERLNEAYEAISLIINASHDLKCNPITNLFDEASSPLWDYMVCNSAMINEMPYFQATGPPNDMFWETPAWPQGKLSEHCEQRFGEPHRPEAAMALDLGVDALLASSNMVLYNGFFDPWSSGGIWPGNPSFNISVGGQGVKDTYPYTVEDYPTIVPVTVKTGAHHVDLFFPTPSDPPDLIEARKRQVEEMKKWVKEAQDREHMHHHHGRAK